MNGPASARRHYLDWLRVLATLGVFLYHAVRPFDLTGWHIKNAQLSGTVTLFIMFLGPWGMPFFFFVAGAASWFALRRRSARAFLRERVQRLLVPFVVGAALLMPVMLYVEWRHGIRTGALTASFGRYVAAHEVHFGPRFFGDTGYHLWFLGFLFIFSLLGLPLFLWIQRTAGQRAIARLARGALRRGGILWFFVPVALIQFVLRPFFPDEHDVADFFFRMGFFVAGYLFFADGRFAQALRRDSLIIAAVAALTMIVVLPVAALRWDVVLAWLTTPTRLPFYLVLTLVSITAWAWVLLALSAGMRFLNFTNRWLRYGQEAILPFFVFHQPVILVVAYFVVAWDAPVAVKLPVVVLGSFVVTLGIYEVVIRRMRVLRVLFGMKSREATVISYPQAA